MATTSFGARSAAFLHLLTQNAPRLPVVFIDTGYHFPETLSFSRDLVQRLGLNLKIYRPLLTPEQIESRHGKLWEQGPEGLEKFHEIIRVEPMRRAFQELNPAIWLARPAPGRLRAPSKAGDSQPPGFPLETSADS